MFVGSKVIDLIKKDILPHCAKIPEDFQKKLTSILNKGSIHTATDVLSGEHVQLLLLFP